MSKSIKGYALFRGSFDGINNLLLRGTGKAYLNSAGNWYQEHEISHECHQNQWVCCMHVVITIQRTSREASFLWVNGCRVSPWFVLSAIIWCLQHIIIGLPQPLATITSTSRSGVRTSTSQTQRCSFRHRGHSNCIIAVLQFWTKHDAIDHTSSGTGRPMAVVIDKQDQRASKFYQVPSIYGKLHGGGISVHPCTCKGHSLLG